MNDEKNTDPLDKSEARQKIIESIRNIDVSNFDVGPWTDPNVIRPLPAAQEKFLVSEAQVTFYGGRLCHLS